MPRLNHSGETAVRQMAGNVARRRAWTGRSCTAVTAQLWRPRGLATVKFVIRHAHDPVPWTSPPGRAASGP